MQVQWEIIPWEYYSNGKLILIMLRIVQFNFKKY